MGDSSNASSACDDGRIVKTPFRARHLFIAAIVVVTAVFVLLLPAAGLAVHDTGLFELDGNAVSATAVPPADDWDRVCHQVTAGALCAAASSTTGAKSVDWAADGSLNATIFTTGGSKDPQNIPSWVWKTDTGGLPDKDNLLHSFAARYSATPTDPALPAGPTSCPNGTGGPGQPAFDPTTSCDVLFFGSDRYDNSGDAQQGFWFFQNPVGLGNSSVAGGFAFTGTHANGDLLILSDFSNGGGTSTISVFRWDDTCVAAGNPQPSCADTNLRAVASSNSANCATAGANDAFCGIVNASTTSLPWPFTDKSGTPGNGALNGELFEGGINLSLLGVANLCFSSVLSETRSSTSTTATLKDFVLGNLQQCQVGLKTTPTDAAGGTSPFDIGTGSLTVHDSAVLNVVGAQNWSGTLRFFLCKVAGINDTCAAGGTQIGAAKAIDQSTPQPIVSDSATVTAAANGTALAPGRYCWRGEFTSPNVPGSTDAGPSECFVVNPAQPSLTTNASNAELGGAITDTATLQGTAKAPGNPVINGPAGAAAGGSITFSLYGPNDPGCSGAPVFQTVRAVSGDGTYPNAAQAPVSFRPSATGAYRWVATYSGDSPNTLLAAGACGDQNETSSVVDANIQIAPSGVNEVGHDHTFTVTINAIPGATTPSFLVNAINYNGGVNSANSTCANLQVNGNAATCTITINATSARVVAVEVVATVTMGGVAVQRTTDGTHGSSGQAIKRYVDASIDITPSATNEIGHQHVFTITTTAVPSGTQATLSSVTPTVTSAIPAASRTQSDTCANPVLAGNTATCTVTVNSSVPGLVTVNATSIWHFESPDPGANPASVDVTRTTDGQNANGAAVTKTFVDANIQIGPPSAVNPVGRDHTVTGHVNVDAGAGFVNAPDGTTISFVLSGSGSFVGSSSCQTSGGTGSCSAVFVSNAPGSSSVKAKTDVTVGGVALHRETGDAKAGDSADASKLWADDAPRTDILDANGNILTIAVSGTVVHDKVYVARASNTPAGAPDPSGNVIFHRYATIDCTGPSTDETVALTPGSPSTALSSNFAPTSDMSYQAEYLGDSNYPRRAGACEPLTVAPAAAPSIAIVKNPKSQTVAIGGTATFQITVTNSGNTVLTNVTVTDPLSPNCNRTSAQIPALATMAPGAAVTYSCTRPNVTGTFTNTATATGTPPSGPNVTARDTAPVKAQALKPPTVKKKPKVKAKPRKKPKMIAHHKPKSTG